MKKSDFLSAVKHEVESLKKFATPKEIERLDLSRFNPDNQEQCIYGQMTGSCESNRAKELMDKSCVIVTKKVNGVNRFLRKKFINVAKLIDGEYSKQTWHEDYLGE